MTRVFLAVAIALLVALAAPAGAAHGGGHGGGGMHGGYHGRYHGYHGGYHHHGSHVFVGGSFFFDPFGYGYPYYYYPYGYPYGYYPYAPYGYPDYPPPPDDEASAGQGQPYGEGQPEAEAPPDAEAEASPPPSARIGTYGLVQLHGVPDGAAVDLDGRFWLTADGLDDRWLALPEGNHTVTVRVGNRTPLQRSFDVRPGASTVVRFPSPRRG